MYPVQAYGSPLSCNQTAATTYSARTPSAHLEPSSIRSKGESALIYRTLEVYTMGSSSAGTSAHFAAPDIRLLNLEQGQPQAENTAHTNGPTTSPSSYQHGSNQNEFVFYVDPDRTDAPVPPPAPRPSKTQGVIYSVTPDPSSWLRNLGQIAARELRGIDDKRQGTHFLRSDFWLFNPCFDHLDLFSNTLRVWDGQPRRICQTYP